MIVDVNCIEDNSTINSEVCIIGGGAAGIALANGLLKSQRDILLIEAGGLKFNKKRQESYRGSVIDSSKHGALDKYRRKVFGGTTTVWGGRCAPFDEIDFEYREGIADTGWPITLRDLLPYYKKSHCVLDLGEFDYDSSSISGKPISLIDGFSTGIFENKIWRFSLPTDLRKKYFHVFKCSRNLRVLLNSECTCLNTSKNGSTVNNVEIITDRLKKFCVRANYYVLACGGLENTRLLLISHDKQPGAFKNVERNIGRFYLSHLSGLYGSVKVLPRSRLTAWNFTKTTDGVYSKRRIKLRDEIIRKEGLLNTSFLLDNYPPQFPEHRNAVLSSLYIAKMFFSGRIPPEFSKALSSDGYQYLAKHLLNIVRDPLSIAVFYPHFVAKRYLYKRKMPGIATRNNDNLFYLHFDSEQSPCFNSTVTLNYSDTDELGRPKLLVDWKYNKSDVVSIRRSFQLLEKDIIRANIGEMTLNTDDLEVYLEENLSVGSHHIGTTRMSNTENNGVVDLNCKVFGSSNLFLAGPSVFPTSGYANPVLTAVALANMLADHLLKLL
jgi:hypothetical protein